MKKTYIKPENTIVLLNTETMIAQSGKMDETKEVPHEGDYYTPGAREVIQAPDPWEEW